MGSGVVESVYQRGLVPELISEPDNDRNGGFEFRQSIGWTSIRCATRLD